MANALSWSSIPVWLSRNARCGQKIYGYFHETDLLCEACTPPPPDPKKKLIEYLKKHMGVTFTAEEMDTFFEKSDPKLLLDEINRRQKASRREKGRRSSVMTGEKHPSVKIISVRAIFDGKGKMLP